MSAAARKISAPDESPETKVFWDAAREGKLMVKRCNSTGRAFYPPRALSPFDLSDDTSWEETNGEGEIYTFSIMRRSPTGPYVAAYVKLDAGPTMITNIITDNPDDLAIGQRVQVKFVPSEDGAPVPMFEPKGE